MNICIAKECNQILAFKRQICCSSTCRFLVKNNISKSDFNRIVSLSASWSEVERYLNPFKIKSEYTVYKQAVALGSYFNVDTKHFTKRLWNKGLKTSTVSLKTLLNNPNAKSSLLKKFLILEGIKEAKCERPGCGLSEWFGKPAILELEHVDGNIKNNSLENLRIYCLQCHAQTPTWRRQKSSLVGKNLLPDWELASLVE